MRIKYLQFCHITAYLLNHLGTKNQGSNSAHRKNGAIKLNVNIKMAGLNIYYFTLITLIAA